MTNCDSQHEHKHPTQTSSQNCQHAKNWNLANYPIERLEVRDAIVNNDKIEDKLHVIMVVSNPIPYQRRYQLAQKFIKNFDIYEKDCILYIVELVYGKQHFYLTEESNPHHLQIRTEHCPLWHKENLINLGVRTLLPKTWKAFAWIDADIEFENHHWGDDTLRVLNGQYDIVQLFSHCLDLDQNMDCSSIFSSAGFQRVFSQRFSNKQPNYSHPGFGWAMTRKAYEKLGGLYENAILGSGDNIMLFGLFSIAIKSVHKDSHPNYINDILTYQKNIQTLRFGYVPGLVKHYFHGKKVNRKYTERWMILVKYGFDPTTFITRDINGLIIPTDKFPENLKRDILNYFKERNEDEFLD